MPWLVVIGLNALAIESGAWMLIRWPFDWGVLAQLPERLTSGTLYLHTPGYNFAWSPAAAWIIATFVLPLGYWVWFAMHIVLLALLRDVRLIALAVLSLPLWIDAGLGNVMAFVFISGILALRGGRAASLGYLALFVLMPRPIQLPLALWLLWHRPSLRLPFVLMAVGVVITTVASGQLTGWLSAVTGMVEAHADGIANLGPTRWFGLAWLVAAVPVAAWLTARRYPGLAGLMVTPYLFPQYLIFLLLDVQERRCRVVMPQVAYRRRSDRWLSKPGGFAGLRPQTTLVRVAAVEDAPGRA